MRGRADGVVHVLVRLGVAGVLLWAGVAKALDRQTSILAVDAYDVLPEALVRPVAMALPWVEIAVAVLLVVGLFVRFAGLATVALALVFLIAMAQARARGLAIDCGCFGGGGPGEGVTWWDIARDGLVLAAGAWIAWRPGGSWQLDRWFLEEEEDRGVEAERETRAPAVQG